jgi:hypothetical protein
MESCSRFGGKSLFDLRLQLNILNALELHFLKPWEIEDHNSVPVNVRGSTLISYSASVKGVKSLIWSLHDMKEPFIQRSQPRQSSKYKCPRVGASLQAPITNQRAVWLGKHDWDEVTHSCSQIQTLHKGHVLLRKSENTGSRSDIRGMEHEEQ